jgi:hypothetical protein
VARNVWSPDYPWGAGPEYVEANERELQHWGTLVGARIWAEAESMYGHVITEEEIRAYAKLSRHTATPDVARELNRIWYETDIRPVLPSVNVPALLLDQHENQRDVEETQYVASLMPQADLKVVPQGVMTSPEVLSAVVDEIRRFVGVEPPMAELDTVLATVLFTDIVASTEKQSALGGHAWKELIQRHHAIVREGLERWHGVEVDTAGDGFYATFARFGVRSTSLSGSGSLGSRSARACTPGNARSSTASAPGSLSPSAHESPRRRAPLRSAFRRRSRTS